jgi:DNA-binding IclR family transcriptional regulator
VLSGQKLSRDGWIETSEDREKGVASVSAPIRDADGIVLAALSLSGPLERLTTHPGEVFGARVVAAALSITKDS